MDLNNRVSERISGIPTAASSPEWGEKKKLRGIKGGQNEHWNTPINNVCMEVMPLWHSNSLIVLCVRGALCGWEHKQPVDKSPGAVTNPHPLLSSCKYWACVPLFLHTRDRLLITCSLDSRVGEETTREGGRAAAFILMALGNWLMVAAWQTSAVKVDILMQTERMPDAL